MEEKTPKEKRRRRRRRRKLMQVYLVFIYKPKHKYDGFITEGHYESTPKVFRNVKDAETYCRNYKHATYIKAVKLR